MTRWTISSGGPPFQGRTRDCCGTGWRSPPDATVDRAKPPRLTSAASVPAGTTSRLPTSPIATRSPAHRDNASCQADAPRHKVSTAGSQSPSSILLNSDLRLGCQTGRRLYDCSAQRIIWSVGRLPAIIRGASLRRDQTRLYLRIRPPASIVSSASESASWSFRLMINLLPR